MTFFLLNKASICNQIKLLRLVKVLVIFLIATTIAGWKVTMQPKFNEHKRIQVKLPLFI